MIFAWSQEWLNRVEKLKMQEREHFDTMMYFDTVLYLNGWEPVWWNEWLFIHMNRQFIHNSIKEGKREYG